MEEKKKTFHIVLYTEVAYILVMALLSSAVSLTILTGWGTPLGTSLFYVLNQWIPRFSIGEWSWAVQVMLLIILILIVRQVHLHYFLSLLTSFIYGFALDFFKNLFSVFTVDSFWERLICFCISFLLLGIGILIFMRSNTPMTVFDLFVKEVTAVKKLKLGAVKTIFDVTILTLTAGMGLLFFGRLVGLGIGTVIIALFTGMYLQLLDGFITRTFVFRPLIFGRHPKQQGALAEPSDLMEDPPKKAKIES